MAAAARLSRNEAAWGDLIDTFEAMLESELGAEGERWVKSQLGNAREALHEGTIFHALALGDHARVESLLDDYLDRFEDGGTGLTALLKTVCVGLHRARAWSAIDALVPIAAPRFKARGFLRWHAQLLVASIEGALERGNRTRAHALRFELEDIDAQLAPGSTRDALTRLFVAG